jgi:hypothetical protein
MGFVQVGGERERGRIAGKIFKNLFFKKKQKCNLEEQKWVMT